VGTAVAEQPARVLAPFARATREALESVAAGPVATSLLFRALTASSFASVPEDTSGFRAFIDGALRTELQRTLGPAAVTLVLGRLGQVALMNETATGPTSSWPPKSRHESGSHPVVRTREPFPAQGAPAAKRQTLPAPAMAANEGPARSERRLRPPAATLPAMPKMTRPLPSCVLVVSLDKTFVSDVQREVGDRCPVVVVQSPAELARAATHAVSRIVVLVGILPSIDLPTFVGLAPILPADTRIVLWGTDQKTLQRLGTRLPASCDWIASGDSKTPGTFALSIF
jgi:hypothetical protein